MSFQHIERSASVVTLTGGLAFHHQLLIAENPGSVTCRVPQLSVHVSMQLPAKIYLT